MSGRTQRRWTTDGEASNQQGEQAPGALEGATGRTRLAGRGAPIARSTAWTRMIESARIDEPLLVHWVDEQGSVVRLMTSTPPSDGGITSTT